MREERKGKDLEKQGERKKERKNEKWRKRE